jgi:signal peptidase I
MKRHFHTNSIAIPILSAIIFAICIRLFVLDFVQINGDSMRPYLKHGDMHFVFKAAYGLKNPFTNTYFLRWGTVKTGDIVLFIAPDGRLAVKRVQGTETDQNPEYSPVPPGYVIVLGDYPAASWDSRAYGPVSIEILLGKVAE